MKSLAISSLLLWLSLSLKFLPLVQVTEARNCIVNFGFTSELPDYLIHHIFSFLTARDVANASVVSKNWNRAWSTYSYVAFHFIFYSNVVEENQPSGDPHIQWKKKDFLSVMQRSIHRRLEQELRIRRFQLYIDFPDMEMMSRYVDKWIDVAMKRSVLELAFRVDCLLGRQRSYYNVPQFVLLANSLKVLSLSGCAFGNGIYFKLPNLQKLSLSHCRFPGKYSFQNIISGCPVIEYVKISFSNLLDPLLVKGLSQLKSFEILLCDYVQNIEIQASTLQKFSFASSKYKWPRSINLSPCVALKELKLSVGGLSAEFAPQPLISQLPALEVLELHECFGSQHFMISSQKLKRLIFRDCCHLSGAEIDTPNLQSLECCNCDEPFVPVNASSEIKVHLIFSLRGNTVDLLTRLKDFLLKLSCNEDLKLILYQQAEHMIVHEKLKNVVFSSLCNFMHPIRICISSRSYSDLMDELFPVAYPGTLFVIHSCGELVELIAAEMNKLRCHPKMQHKLVGFKVESFKDLAQATDRATYFFIKAHTAAPYQTSAIILDWVYRVSSYRITF